VERSIPQGVGPAANDGLKAAPDELEEDLDDAPDSEAPGRRFSWGIALGYLLPAVVFAIYFLIHLDRPNNYLHFVLQAQAWLDGETAIPMPPYQDVMPIVGPDGAATGMGIIPFPPLPAWVIVPFVAFFHEATDQQMLSAIFGAVDVGIAYWVLGRLPIRTSVRFLTATFLGLGTVLFYTSAIGTTWFWAHVVAVACLLLSVGFALAADPKAATPEPLAEVRGVVRGGFVPGGLRTAGLLVAGAVLGEGFLWLAGSGAPPAALALDGLALAVVAVLLAVVVSGRWRVLATGIVVVSCVVGIPGLFVAATLAPMVAAVVDLVLIVVLLAIGGMAAARPDALGRIVHVVADAVTDPEALQVAAGMLFGLAVMARLTILFGFPFLMLVGGGGTWMRRSLLAGAGAAIPLLSLLVVTYATSGQLFNPAYDYLYQNELFEYGSVLGYNATWSISDIRYVPQNLMIMLFNGPEIAPNFIGIVGPDYGTPACQAAGATRGLFDATCPLAMPNAVGTSIFFASPAFLFAPFAWGPLARAKLDRVTVGATIAVLGIAFVNLMHFSQGWVQFGYRFSNDFVPFAIVLVALAANRLWSLELGRVRVFAVTFVGLVGLSIVVNFWGTIWGAILGW